jgi:hypothetical protein
MKESVAVREALQDYYERFSAHDPDAFEAIVATGDGISVIGSAPGEGHTDRASWLDAYRQFTTELQLRIEGGPNPRAWEEGGFGYAIDEPRFVIADGRFVPARVTVVMHQEYAEWKVLHMHVSVGVPDEEALRSP